MKNKVYSFSTNDAEKYGIDAAVILHNMRYWLDYARAHGEMENDGYYWMYATASKMTEIFPFWSANKIQKLLKKLECDGVIISGSYSKSRFDRTKWYTMPEYSIQPNGGIRGSESAESLYDQYEDKNTNTCAKQKKERLDYDVIKNIFNSTLTKAPSVVKITDSRKKLVKKLFTDFDLDYDKFENYLSFLNEHPDAQWMFEKRPKNDGSGQYWNPRTFEYFVNEKCFLNAKENLQ